MCYILYTLFYSGLKFSAYCEGILADKSNKTSKVTDLPVTVSIIVNLLHHVFI